MEIPQNCIITIFGATGDLTKRKLLPALFELYKQKLLPKDFALLGVSRIEMTHNEFRGQMSEAIKSFANKPDEAEIKKFLINIHYSKMEFGEKADYEKLKKELTELESCVNCRNVIFYLATPPALFETIGLNLGASGLSEESDNCFRRLIVEKPFGKDLESAIDLNNKLHTAFKEKQIYRIDHYLGKETVQNIFVTRFSNGIFEPVWDRNFIDHIEITSAESIGVEKRGAYYEGAGALRDMVQNHLLQILGYIALEPPSTFDANAIRNEQLKVLQSIRPVKESEVNKNVIRGQYTASTVRGEKITGYREEPNVNPESRTETFVAMKFFIDNWRWSGVPFYLRTGKRLPTRVTEVVIHFKPTPHNLFHAEGLNNAGNQFVIRIQPDEGILLKIGMKVPGAGYKVHNVNMDYHYTDFPEIHIPEAYERLLHDCMIGDATLFARADVVEEAWRFVKPIQDAWANNPDIKIYGYPAGTWGPENADELIEGEELTWRYPCKNLADDGIHCEL